jgi:hyperosmotically inducible protein
MSSLQKSDAEIQHDVLRELAWDTRLDEAEVGVSVHEGVVSLNGSVNSWGKRLAAQEAAHRVAGVLDVANDLEVKLGHGLMRDDVEIAHVVRLALKWNSCVPNERIQSTVSLGVVTLGGEVELLSQRVDAERAVSHLVGVSRVVNNILVVPPHIASDVHASIASALQRHASRAAEHIELRMQDGLLTISGHVQSWAEKQLVLGAASTTVGVQAIEDQVAIGI